MRIQWIVYPVDIGMPRCHCTFLVEMVVRPRGERTCVQVTAACNMQCTSVIIWYWVQPSWGGNMLPHPHFDRQNRHFFSPAFSLLFKVLDSLTEIVLDASIMFANSSFLAMEASNSFLSFTFQRVGEPQKLSESGSRFGWSCVDFIRNVFEDLSFGTYFETPITVSYGTFGEAKELDVIGKGSDLMSDLGVVASGVVMNCMCTFHNMLWTNIKHIDSKKQFALWDSRFPSIPFEDLLGSFTSIWCNTSWCQWDLFRMQVRIQNQHCHSPLALGTIKGCKATQHQVCNVQVPTPKKYPVLEIGTVSPGLVSSFRL